MDKKNYVERACDYFNSGSSCAQSVFTAFHDEMGMTEEAAQKLSGSFGGGVGGLREVCGAFLAMSMALGALKGYLPGDQEAKEKHYALIQQKADSFRLQFKTIICRDLLLSHGITPTAKPAERTAEYYTQRRPCTAYVEACAQFVQDELELLPDR